MRPAFHRVLTVLSILSLVAVGALLVKTDAISDFLFSLPTWVVLVIIVAWPLILLLTVVVLAVPAKRGDEMLFEALRQREAQDYAAELPENVHELPERESAKILYFPGGGWRL